MNFDELDVTMEVLDSIADLDGKVLEMRGPESDGDGGDEAETDGESDDVARG